MNHDSVRTAIIARLRSLENRLRKLERIEKALPVLLADGVARYKMRDGAGIGTADTPLYARPPKAEATGPDGITGIGTTMTDVLTITLVTTQLCDIDIGGHLRVKTNVVTDSTNTWAWQVTLDGMAGQPYVDYSPNGKQATGIVSERRTLVSAGTHTIKLQASASGTSNTIDVVANRAQIFATAILY